MIRFVVIESPFKGATPADEARNVRYVRALMRDALLRGEVPFASHALYTLPGVLDDSDPDERSLGMQAGWGWFHVLAAAQWNLIWQVGVVVGTDLGISEGMREGIARAEEIGLPVEERSLPEWKGAAL